MALAQTPVSDEDRITFNAFTEKLASEGIDPLDLPINAGLSEKLSENSERIKAILGSSYAGQWLKYDEDGRAQHIVATTNSIIPKNINLDYDVRFVLVERSMEELKTIFETIITAHENNKERDWEIYSFYIDELFNKVGVRGKEENKNKILDFVKDSGIDLKAVDFEISNGPMVPYENLIAGQKLRLWNPTDRPSCTSGFNATLFRDGIPYDVALTAGHCADLHTPIFFDASGNNKFIGQVVINKLNINLDAAIFVNANWAHNLLPRYTVTFGSSPVEGVKDVSLLSYVCSFGGTSGLRCGHVNNPAAMHRLRGKPVLLAEVNFCSAPGDSGGPVLQGRNAVGLFTGVPSDQHGPYGNCGPTVGGGGSKPISLFQPIAPVLRSTPGLIIKTNR